MKKGMKIASLVINALIFLCILFGTILVIFINKSVTINSTQFAQIQTAWPLGIAGLVMAITDMFSLKRKDHKLAGFPVWLKFITTSAITFLVLYIVIKTTLIEPEASIGYPSLLSLVTTPYGILIIVVPFILSVVSFIFLEKGRAIHYKMFWTAMLVPLIYGALIMVLNATNVLYTPIDFLRVVTWKDDWARNLLYIGVILVSLMVIGIILLVFHNIGIKGRIAALDETVDETPVDLAPEATQPTLEQVVVPAEQNEIKINISKIIHINPVDKTWQLVVSDTGYIASFDSREDAIKEACKIAENDNYSIRVHLGKGK